MKKVRRGIVVLPTGTGKSIIAFFLASEIAKDGKVLFLAPTKPLVHQHYVNFKKIFPEIRSGVVDGTIAKEKRKKIYDESTVIFSTPQTIENDFDLISGVAGIIFDECHRAVGNYSYVKIADHFFNEKIRYYGFTASPGSDVEKIGMVKCNLRAERIIAKSEKDLREYIPPVEIKWIKVEQTKEMREIISLLREKIEEEKKMLSLFGIEVPKKRALFFSLREIIEKLPPNQRFEAFFHYTFLSHLFRIEELVAREGFEIAYNYLEKMKEKGRIGKRFLEDKSVFMIKAILARLILEKKEHPKFSLLRSLVNANKGKKIIIFAEYRFTARKIFDMLEGEKYLLMGKREGMTKKKQAQVLELFRGSKDGILVSTSVGEEGIDVPSADIVIFFEPVPSEIRAIQRKGRVGRTKAGKIYILMTKDSLDEAYYWASRWKEKTMRSMITIMDAPSEKKERIGQSTLDKFF